MTHPQHLQDLINVETPEAVRDEVAALGDAHYPELDRELVFQALDDVELLHRGDFPGFRASNTAYHNFGHTCSVVVAAIRIMYGRAEEGRVHPVEAVLVGVLSALFHDVGLIQDESDNDGTGAKHTVGHEQRSISFMREYLSGQACSGAMLDHIELCIGCTELAVPIDTISFPSDDIKVMGQITGAADLLAQIADRHYLERLLLLFEEFREAGIPGYDTPMELLQKTRGFYINVARKRLENDCGGVDRFLRPYFQSRWGINGDLYTEAIEANMGYIDFINQQCKDDFDCFLRHLQRTDIVDTLYPDRTSQ